MTAPAPEPTRARPASLIGRLVAVAAIGLALGVPALVAGTRAMVDRFAREAVDTQIRGLGAQLRGVWASAAAATAPKAPTRRAAPPAIALADLEWVWQISVDGRVVARGGALELVDVTLTGRLAGPTAAFVVGDRASRIGELRIAERLVDEAVPRFSDDDTVGPATARVRYLIGVRRDRYLADVARVAAEVGGLWRLVAGATAGGVLAMLGLFLLVASRELGRVGRALDAYEHGRTDRVVGRFPRELDRLVQRINAMLGHTARLAARARKYALKIAHDLGHPVTIVRNELARPSPDLALAARQLDRMAALIARTTNLAAAIGRDGVGVAPRIAIAPVLADVRDGYRLMLRRDPVEITVACPETLNWAIPRPDLEAMVGNLVGNAHRHAASRIVISAEAPTAAHLRITVADDGPGIAAEDRAAALAWGGRLDQARPGTGIGLAIVADLVDLHGGSLALDSSAALGGLEATITLPAAGGTQHRRMT